MIIQGFPKEIIGEVSEFTASFVRPVVKLPLITILISCGVAVALNLSCFTFVGELLQSGTFTEAPWLIAFLLVWGIGSALALLFVTNFVVSIFDQVDVIPVY
mmetsp:Transcript_43560/g.57674  ORF Transcript_43560/g.57674 Transcript_43560/m.57674 type:complete len:102 (+) Transcript_43560:711-1016(+)